MPIRRLLWALLLTSVVLATDPPVANTGTFAVCVLSPKQCTQIPAGRNFASKHSPDGNCLGWVFATQTLLSHLDFDPSQPANPETTRRAIVQAFRSATTQTIPGYASLNQLTEEADAAWVELVDEKNQVDAVKLHPVQQAIMDLQHDQPGLLHRLLNTKPLQTTTEGSTQLATQLDARLRLGMPSQLGIRKLGDTGGHAVLVVGFEAVSKEELPTKFFILDPNSPRQLQTLRLEKLGIEGVEDDTYWAYDAIGWEGADWDKVANKTRRVTQLASEKNPAVRLAKKVFFDHELAQLKKLKGALKVDWIKGKKDSEKLLRAAFKPYQLPTEPPEMEPFNRVFGDLFRVPGACPTQPESLLRHQSGPRPPQEPTHQIPR
jgi:hypothetical protein